MSFFKCGIVCVVWIKGPLYFRALIIENLINLKENFRQCSRWNVDSKYLKVICMSIINCCQHCWEDVGKSFGEAVGFTTEKKLLIKWLSKICVEDAGHWEKCLVKMFPDTKKFWWAKYTGLSSRSQDQTGLIMLLDLFLLRFFFNFLSVPCGGLSWLHVSFLLHIKHTISYCIVWARK